MNDLRETNIHQWTLRGLMWFVTIVAVLCGISRLVVLRWPGIVDWEELQSLSLPVFWVMMFWPTLLALARAHRFRLAATVARLMILTVSFLAFAALVGVQSFDIFLYPVIIVVAWPPQMAVIWIIHRDMRDWEHRFRDVPATQDGRETFANTDRSMSEPSAWTARRDAMMDQEGDRDE